MLFVRSSYASSGPFIDAMHCCIQTTEPADSSHDLKLSHPSFAAMPAAATLLSLAAAVRVSIIPLLVHPLNIAPVDCGRIRVTAGLVPLKTTNKISHSAQAMSTCITQRSNVSMMRDNTHAHV